MDQVHYRSFPSQELITCDDVTTPRSAFVNSLKEAAFALTGSSSAIMNWLGRLEDTWRHVQDGNVAQCLSEMAAFNLHPSLVIIHPRWFIVAASTPSTCSSASTTTHGLEFSASPDTVLSCAMYSTLNARRESQCG